MTSPFANALGLLLLIPLLAAAVLAVVRNYQTASRINVGASALTFAAAVWLAISPVPSGELIVTDALSTVFVLLTTFVGLTTSVFSASYIGQELHSGRLKPSFARYYPTLFQALMFGMNLALVANNIGVMWVAIELTTLTTVLLVGLYQSHHAIEAAWKYFILGSVGIALALFGTILVYLAAQPFLGEGLQSMMWTSLVREAGRLDPSLFTLAFVFLLVGYGTKVGLVPLHGWLPDAHAEGPTPVSAILSGLLLNIGLYAILRFKIILSAIPAAIPPGPLMIALGLLSVIFAACMLYRRRDIKRLFAYSSIEHMGIATFAFGLGGPVADFAGLLHMTTHSLTKSAIFFVVGRIAQIKGTQKVSELQGLTVSHPWLGWSLIVAVAALAGLPPFGIFMSEFLLITSSVITHPVVTLLFVAGLLISAGALFMLITQTGFGAPLGEGGGQAAVSLPAYVHIALVLIAGTYLPMQFTDWFQQVAMLLK